MPPFHSRGVGNIQGMVVIDEGGFETRPYETRPMELSFRGAAIRGAARTAPPMTHISPVYLETRTPSEEISVMPLGGGGGSSAEMVSVLT